MKSAVIKRLPAGAASEQQLTLSFEPGVSDRFGSLRECVATGRALRGLLTLDETERLRELLADY